MPPASSWGGASRSTSPTRDITAEPSSARQPTGSASPGTMARASALFGATGPPRKTTDGPVTRSVQDSSTCPTGTSVGRFSTTPERALLWFVLHHEHDGAPEIWVTEQRRGDQQPAREVLLHASILSDMAEMGRPRGGPIQAPVS